jgi:hypothetical protein
MTVLSAGEEVADFQGRKPEAISNGSSGRGVINCNFSKVFGFDQLLIESKNFGKVR